MSQAQEKLREAADAVVPRDSKHRSLGVMATAAELDRILGYSELVRQLDAANRPDPRVSELVQQRQELLEALKVVEWVWVRDSLTERCPWCDGTRLGHAPDCKRQAAIRKVEEK